jgi:signal transduction histidine kinase
MVFVKDAGPGIAPEALPRIFEPLFTTKSRGVGLGLAICKSFVERNGGVISVESEPGKGATFIVTLPVAEPLKPQATSREQPK